MMGATVVSPEVEMDAVDLRIKRIYEPVGVDDGARILVDGIWPRGISKDRASLHSWRKDVAPSRDLRTWFGHRVDRWSRFRERYRSELASNGAVLDLIELLGTGRVTLLYSARDERHNQAVVLAEVLTERCTASRS